MGSSSITPEVQLSPLLTIIQKVEFPRKLGLCEMLFADTLKANGVCWVNTANGVQWKLDLRNPTHRWIVYGLYEGGGLQRWVQRNLPADGVIVDSGANIGQMTLYFSRLLPEATILCVEPGISAVNWLRECLRRNALDQVLTVQAALGAERASMFLQNSDQQITHGGQGVVSAEKGQPIDVLSLSQILDEHQLEIVHLWKLDVEGYELQALQGASRHLQNERIKAIFVEMSAHTESEVYAYLKGFGYKAHRLLPDGQAILPASEHSDRNILFLRNDRKDLGSH